MHIYVPEYMCALDHLPMFSIFKITKTLYNLRVTEKQYVWINTVLDSRVKLGDTFFDYQQPLIIKLNISVEQQIGIQI